MIIFCCCYIISFFFFLDRFSSEWNEMETKCLPCPVGWSSFAFLCCFSYFHELNVTTFAEAKQYCVSLNSTLLELKNRQKFKFFVNYFETNNITMDVWIDAIKKQDLFYWPDETRIEDDYWRSGRSTASRTDCVQFNSLKLIEYECHKSVRSKFICEQPIIKRNVQIF